MEMEEKIRVEAEKKKKDLEEQQVSLHNTTDYKKLLWLVRCVKTLEFCSQKLEAKMKELERQYQEDLERAQEEAAIKMGELAEALQGKVSREMELEREREILRTEADEIKVLFPFLRNGRTFKYQVIFLNGQYH